MIHVKEILDYIIETKNMLQDKHNNEAVSGEEKKFYQDQIDAFSNVESWMVWRLKTPDEKQVARIRELATMRKIDALPEFIKNQERMIEVYEVLKSTSIYIEALDTSVLDGLKIFCKELMNLIDFKPRSFGEKYPTVSEIKQAFNPYFEITKPAKGNGNMFKECYEKIEKLYDELMKLNEKEN